MKQAPELRDILEVERYITSGSVKLHKVSAYTVTANTYTGKVILLMDISKEGVDEQVSFSIDRRTLKSIKGQYERLAKVIEKIPEYVGDQ